MKVITTAFFKDFARYFCYLEDEYKKKSNHAVDFLHVAIYPCAYRYFKNKGRKTVFSGNIKKSGFSGAVLKNSDYNELIYFNSKSLSLYGVEADARLKERAGLYYEYFDELFKNNKFDLLISSGDTRLLPSVVIMVAKKNNVKVVFFEQGPFGTTMFDRSGVNANISFTPSFRQLTNNEKIKIENFISFGKYKNTVKYYEVERKNNIYDLATLLYLYPPKWILSDRVCPIDLEIGLGFFNFLRSYFKNKFCKNTSRNEVELDENNKIISLFLQVPVDAQLIEHSPNYSCFYEIVSDVYNALPEGAVLVVREHPQYINRYDKKIYEFCKKKDVYIDNDLSLDELINKSSVCIVNNSTVGIEALLRRKNVVALGKAYYTNKGVTYDYGKDIELSFLIKNALEVPFDSNRFLSFLYEFVFEYLFAGHFQDLKLQFDYFKFQELLGSDNEKNIVNCP